MRNGLQKTLLLLLFCHGASAAETVYVDDEIRLGVRGAPSAAESSIAVVKTGDALTLLEEQEGFLKIRTEKGVEGWVSKGYVSEKPPAKLQLQELQENLDALQKTRDTLQMQLEQNREQVEQKGVQLAQMEKANVALQQQLGRYTNSSPSLYEKYRWYLFASLFVVCFLAGLYTGVRWKAHQVAERIGGLEI